MDQILVIDEIITSLREHGYSVLSMGLFDPQYWIKSSFDIAARKDVLLMIKIVINIDKIPAELVEDLKLITYFFNGSPLIVGKETRKDSLRDDVVYERRGIPAVNLHTFKHLLNKNNIYVISRKGGFYVKIDSDKIQELRLKQGFSLKDVASEIGVSRKAVYLFEQESQIKEDNIHQIKEVNVHQLEKLFAQELKLPIDVFNWEIEKKEVHSSVEETDFQAEIKELFEELGFNTYWAKKAPFDAITSKADKSKEKSEKSCLITGLSMSRKMRIYNRLQIISEISKVARKLSMFIIENGKLPTIDNVLILQKAILEKIKDIQQLYDKLKKVKRTFY
ncbi:MAG: transcriptional regulator [Promethearchaeota archaeon]